MGLDAVVYRNRKHLELGPDEQAAQLIPETGEVYFEDGEISRKHQHQLHATKHRFGNIAEISALRDEVTRLVGPKSTIVEKILYSGTHIGCTIPVESVSSLLAEITSIKRANWHSPELRRFVGSLEGLIRAAKDEGNPIVFV